VPAPAGASVNTAVLEPAWAGPDATEALVATPELTVIVRLLEPPRAFVDADEPNDGHEPACLCPFVEHAHIWRGGAWECLGAATRAFTSATRPQLVFVRRCAS
jgi:hypothetical protein